MNDDIIYCPTCGTKTIKKMEGKVKRDFCGVCKKFHYKNPPVAVAAVCFLNNGIVFIKRKYNPCKGLWTLPGGFVEAGETIEQALKREIKEETGLKIKKNKLLKVITVKSKICKSIILFGFFVEVANNRLKAGDDAQSIKIINVNKLPKTFTEHKILIKKALKLKKEK
ncbi:MAG: NUDIX hydrolase [Candidatus Goldbacteria bacterium]|nr:NUDIX hydrolase [Candidatus Goldiibacteriota bacterium]